MWLIGRLKVWGGKRLRIYDFYDDGVTVRVRFEPYYSEKVGLLAVTGV